MNTPVPAGRGRPGWAGRCCPGRPAGRLTSRSGARCRSAAPAWCWSCPPLCTGSGFRVSVRLTSALYCSCPAQSQGALMRQVLGRVGSKWPALDERGTALVKHPHLALRQSDASATTMLPFCAAKCMAGIQGIPRTMPRASAGIQSERLPSRKLMCNDLPQA